MLPIPKYKSWQDFKSKTDPLPNKQKGDDFEVFTKYCLEIHPNYKTQLKQVWLLKNVPTKVHKYLNLPRPDLGIDLIAETKEGKFWAIQCKYKSDEKKSVTLTELATFTSLAFAKCKNIELGLVCTNAEKRSPKLQGYEGRLQFCAGEFWNSLDKEFFKIFHQRIKGKIVLPEAKKPRKHQQRAIKNAHQHFIKERNSRGKLIMPCGAGKSLTAFWMAEKLKSKTILIAVPSLALIRQTLEVWAKESIANKKKLNWIAICSDKSVGDIERDDFVVLTQDLGVPVYDDSNSKKIELWLKKPKTGLSVVFTTYQSGKVIAKAAKKEKINFDLGIMDEAHKTVGKGERLFSYLLYEKNIKIKKRVFMTATERRYQGQSDKILSMEDPAVYGETFELLTFKEALAAKPPILCDYKIVTMLVQRSEIIKAIQKNKFVKPDKGNWDTDVEAAMLASLIGLNKAIKKNPINKAVSFHSSISRSIAFQKNQEIFTKAFKGYKKLETFHVSGKTPASQRSRELEEFADSKYGLITNARCLTEGVDIPKIDCILFSDPKKSTVDIVQAAGRALRPYQGKKFGYIIVPVLLDKELTTDLDKQKEAFAPILMTLRSLAADDERIVEYFRSVSEGRQPSEGSPIETELPDGIDIDAKEFIKSVELKFWSKLAKLSWRPFKEAREFTHDLKLSSYTEWRSYYKGELKNKPKKPDDIPSRPNHNYSNSGWIGWGDWLGTGYISTHKRNYRKFSAARSFMHSMKLKSEKEFRLFLKGKLKGKPKKPDDIPTNPHRHYKNQGWVSMGDWLGTGTIAPGKRKYRSFKEARKFVHSLELKRWEEWISYCKGELKNKPKRPDDIPTNPEKIYKNKGWVSWPDWLSGAISKVKRNWRPFTKAREFARSLNLSNNKEWIRCCKGELKNKPKKPDDIPKYPSDIYKEQGWAGMGDWLGTGRVADQLKKFRSFKEARKFVHRLELASSTEWRKYNKGEYKNKIKKPKDIPFKPERVYKDKGWISYGDWLGTGRVADQLKKFRLFKDARKYTWKIKLKSYKEWRSYCKGELKNKPKKPDDIPSGPYEFYKNKGWVSWPDWLGTDVKPRKKIS